jgi:GNAT superfamily N-acetyltransferase
MRTGDLLLRQLTEQDLPAVQALSAAVHWPHRLEDWQFVHRLGSGLAVESEGGTLVGTAMRWLFGADGGAIGMVIVAPDRQGRGIGRRLMAGILCGLEDRRLLLHATEAGLPLYRGLGFREIGTVRQYQGAAFSVGIEPLRPGERVRPMGRRDLAALAALDRAATGMDRTEALAALVGLAEGVVLDHHGEARGFALLRRFGRGHAIGPVIAPDAPAAKVLIGHWLGRRPGLFTRIDVPEESGLSGWLDGLGLADAGPAVRMLRGGASPGREGGPRARCFALVNQALG